MRRKKQQTPTEEQDRDLLNHVEGLGLTSIDDYRQWCARNGFSRKLTKHWKQRCRERSFSQQAVARERLTRKKQEKRNHTVVLRAICTGELSEDDVTLPHLQRLCQVLRPSRGPKNDRPVDRKVLQRLLTHLHACRAKFFDGTPAISALGQVPGNTYIEAIALTTAHSRSWQRQVEDWIPSSHSASRQFASLLRHLFVKY
ncbi:MAG: hypothetical protein KDA87_24475, partial [Planctomycetales bacterium]|nr:hypothetical protein [Planctomycetales bacterium]